MKDQCYEFIKNQIGKPNIVGFGSYGQVKIARNIQNNQVVAIKLIYGKNAKQEIDVHHKLHHPNIIKLLNYYYEKEKNITYMVLEYAENGSLNVKIKFGLGQLSKQLIRNYFKDICQAVRYLHQHNYMHRDIKPQNILITKDNIAKLCDFGFAAIFEARTTICGTFQYMAPQMIKKRPYNYKIDIWALGILLFQMIQGKAPFKGQRAQEVLSEMKKPIRFSHRFQSLQIDLIKKILRVNSENRPSVDEILNHPYFKSFGYEENSRTSKKQIQLSSQIQNKKNISKPQSPYLIKQHFTYSKQELSVYSKYQKTSEAKQALNNSISNTKEKSPFRTTHFKTEPSKKDENDIQSISRSYRNVPNLTENNNQDIQFQKRKQFRKYSNNLMVQSPLGQKKGISPFHSKACQQDKNESSENFNLYRPQKKSFLPNFTSNKYDLNKSTRIGSIANNNDKNGNVNTFQKSLISNVQKPLVPPLQMNNNLSHSSVNRSFKKISVNNNQESKCSNVNNSIQGYKFNTILVNQSTHQIFKNPHSKNTNNYNSSLQYHKMNKNNQLDTSIGRNVINPNYNQSKIRINGDSQFNYQQQTYVNNTNFSNKYSPSLKPYISGVTPIGNS